MRYQVIMHFRWTVRNTPHPGAELKGSKVARAEVQSIATIMVQMLLTLERRLVL